MIATGLPVLKSPGLPVLFSLVCGIILANGRSGVSREKDTVLFNAYLGIWYTVGETPFPSFTLFGTQRKHNLSNKL